MFSKINTFGLSGMRAFPVTVETDINNGIPYFDMVGMASESVKEAKKRVKAAIINQGLTFPKGHITQNLTPADVRKQGTSFDLALAMGILANSYKLNDYIFEHVGIIGELSLSGDILPVKGVISSIVEGKRNGILTFIVPYANLEEAKEGPCANILPVKTLEDALKWCTLDTYQMLDKSITIKQGFSGKEIFDENFEYDFADVFGQESVKRALLIAAAGNHNVIMSGSPGAGKTMMARCLQSILPPLSYDEYSEVLTIYSSCGLENMIIGRKNRPFRTVHQGVTKAALLGGGRPMEIGELTLAHNGILFMDELAETPRNVVESLRRPIEDKKVHIINCGTREVLPANFMFVGAMNPCPCGRLYEGDNKCVCSDASISSYVKKLSSPFMDRIDIKVPVRSVPQGKIGIKSGENSNGLRNRVIAARELQRKRFEESDYLCNGDVENVANYKCFDIKSNGKKLLEMSSNAMGLSVRSYGKIIKVARTIADLDGRDFIEDEHLLESIQLRQAGSAGGNGAE